MSSDEKRRFSRTSRSARLWLLPNANVFYRIEFDTKTKISRSFAAGPGAYAARGRYVRQLPGRSSAQRLQAARRPAGLLAQGVA